MWLNDTLQIRFLIQTTDTFNLILFIWEKKDLMEKVKVFIKIINSTDYLQWGH